MAGLEEDTEPSQAPPTKGKRQERPKQEPKPAGKKGKGGKQDQAKSRDVIWGRITSALNQQLEAYAKTHKLSKSEVLFEALSFFLERRNDEIAWERAILRLDRRLGVVQESIEQMQGVQLWHLRKYLTLAGPTLEASKQLYEETGKARYLSFLKDMDSQLGEKLRRDLYSVGRAGSQGLPRTAVGEKP